MSKTESTVRSSPPVRGIYKVGSAIFGVFCLLYGGICIGFWSAPASFVAFYGIASLWTGVCLHACLQWYGGHSLLSGVRQAPPADHPGQWAVLVSALLYWSAVAILLACARWIPPNRKLAVFCCQLVLLGIAVGTYAILKWAGKRLASHIEPK